jgi:hypothetical protein
VALESAQSNDSNMLRKEVADAVSQLQSFVLHNMTIDLPDGQYHFGNDICSKLALCPGKCSKRQKSKQKHFQFQS